MQEAWLVFSNVSKQKKKKGRKKEHNILFIYDHILLAFHVMIHFSLCVCVCDSFLHFSIARQKKSKKNLTTDFFSLCVLFSQIRELAFWIFINYAYICAWMHVHGRHLKETVLWATITWSEMGKTYRTNKLKRSIPTRYH